MPQSNLLTICILTQNQETRLGPLLAQAAGAADEVLVVDGGSTDATAARVAREPKARLIQRPFDGNFARQRNFALDSARGEWVFFIDTDELMGPNLLRLLPAILRTSFQSVKFPRYWLAQERPGLPPLFVDSPLHYLDRQLRLFRRRPEARYDEARPVHEAIPKAARFPCLWLRRSHLLHYCLLWNDRAEREARAAGYAAQSGKVSEANRQYLYEDLPHRLRPCREAWIEGRPYVAGAWDCLADRCRLWLPGRG